MKFVQKNACFIALFILGIGFFSSCNNKDIIAGKRDPGKPTVFSDFSPKEGAIRTRLYISGDNFGDDVSKIHVYIGERELKVVGVNGKQIYCWVPGQTSTGKVRVVIDEGSGKTVDHTFADSFSYVKSTSVGTLVGKVDENGNSGIIDGTFEEAGFNYAGWITYEPTTNVVLVSELDRAVRRIDLANRMVSTLITNGQASFNKLQNTTLSTDRDTLYLVDDNGNRSTPNKVAIAYTLRSENYRRVHPVLYDVGAFGFAQHPVDRGLFYTVTNGTPVKKGVPDPVTGELVPKELYRIGGNISGTLLFFHPSGNYAYIQVQSRIYKSMYNWQKQELEPAIIFAGGVAGDVDAIGTSARIERAYQGVFVKNPDYAGQADEYDFYFCDQHNHSIRILAPNGMVTTFAGKGSPTPDGSKRGYIDGHPRLEARFGEPSGIDYDVEHKIFYIAERFNKRIRTITVE
ncbi:IPT/TIG domain-containing protein [Niabella sp. CJ426]|uniref:IPT/TIG domain-containing protein n=1 Tax=Niabella sp. CJ426 TaxID=3393740 RepID=UPI003D065A1F